MKILAINTVDKNYSLALLSSNNLLFTSIYNNNIFNMLNDILYKANLQLSKLDFLLFNKGPGSFTGIRLSSALASVINLSLGTKILGISNLDIIFYKTEHKLYPKNIFLIIFNNQNNFYIVKYLVYKENNMSFYINKKEWHLHNIKSVIHSLNNLKGLWSLYINRDFYINFFNYLVGNDLPPNMIFYVKWGKYKTTAKDLIFCFLLINQLKLSLKLKEEFFTPNKLNYLHNHIAN